MARLAMDVLGLVEVERGALDRLVTALGRRGFSIGHELLDVSRSQDLAVLYDRDTTTATIRRDIYDRHAALLNAKTPSGRTAFPRHPLFAECTVRNGNGRARFLIVVVHLKAFGDVGHCQDRRLLHLVSQTVPLVRWELFGHLVHGTHDLACLLPDWQVLETLNGSHQDSFSHG